MELLSHVTEKQATKSGADALAVISGLFDAPDIAAQARRFGELFEAARA